MPAISTRTSVDDIKPFAGSLPRLPDFRIQIVTLTCIKKQSIYLYFIVFIYILLYNKKGYPFSSTNPLSGIALRQPDCMSPVP